MFYRAIPALILIGTMGAGPLGQTAPTRGELFDDWRDRLESAAGARANDDDARAIELFVSILSDAKSRKESGLLVARAQDGLADLYREQHRFDLAAPLYESAVASWTRLLGPSQPRRAVSLHNLGICYVELAEWDAAERVLRDALVVWNAGGRKDRIAETEMVLDAALARRSIPWKNPPQ